MRYVREFGIDLFSQGVEMFAFPFDVVTGGDGFHAIVADPSHVLVVVGNLVECLRASHPPICTTLSMPFSSSSKVAAT